jgi:hypothetical protein
VYITSDDDDGTPFVQPIIVAHPYVLFIGEHFEFKPRNAAHTVLAVELMAVASVEYVARIGKSQTGGQIPCTFPEEPLVPPA